MTVYVVSLGDRYGEETEMRIYRTLEAAQASHPPPQGVEWTAVNDGQWFWGRPKDPAHGVTADVWINPYEVLG